MMNTTQDSTNQASKSISQATDDAPGCTPERGGERRSFLKMAMAATSIPALAAAMSKDASAANPNNLPTLYQGWNAKNFVDIRADENTHVMALVDTLGSMVRPKPTFKNLVQPNVTSFAWVSRALENTGVGAYLGALPSIQTGVYLTGAASIAMIEARHAGYLNALLNQHVTSNALEESGSFEWALPAEKVVELATPYIASLNGGPPLLPLANDIDILNFALVLEYLEAEFYNINVQRFFGV